MFVSAASPRVISRPRDERDPNFGWFGFERGSQHVFVRSPLAQGAAGARAMFAKCEPEAAEYTEIEGGEPLVVIGFA